MRRARNTYSGYSIGCAIVWAIALLGVAVLADSDKLRTVILVFVGWLSATIARSVDPPPKSRR